MKLVNAMAFGALILGSSLPGSQVTQAQAQSVEAVGAVGEKTIVSRDGHKIAFYVTAGREPAIVLDAGGGLDASYWNTLIPALSRATGARIITYDRAGFGGSDNVDGPWDVHAATRDLEAGLKKLGATRKVVLVSHSLAGEIATYAALDHASWFSGVVLVDANVPQFYTDATIAQQEASYAPVVAALKKAPTSPANRQLLALAASFSETSRAFHQVKWPTALPVTVIVSGGTPFDDDATAQWWKDSHASFAAAAPNRTLVRADDSSHDVAHDRPDIVVDAVVAMDQARSK
ncbi:MAG: alpha/beta fold hydrolase [Alphaproteobacteria bacterium]|nr:alpha/beta fold hydrolase [Alphaproteobacteria bacterium]